MSSPARSALVKSNWINKIDLQIVWQNNICSQNKQLTVLCNKRVRVIVKINQTKRNEIKRTAQKWSFSLRISSVNVTKSAGNWKHLLKKSLMENFMFFFAVTFKRKIKSLIITKTKFWNLWNLIYSELLIFILYFCIPCNFYHFYLLSCILFCFV